MKKSCKTDTSAEGTEAVGPTVSFVGHGKDLKLTRQTIMELDPLYDISSRDRAKIAVWKFSHHSE